MIAIKKARYPRARAALLAALGLVFAGSFAAVARAQEPAQPNAQAEAHQGVPYKSSIQVPYDSTQAHKGHRGHHPIDPADLARYQKLARITADQAQSAALAKVPGTAKMVRLMNDRGNLVYGVAVTTPDGKRWVKVDAGNGDVLQVREARKH